MELVWIEDFLALANAGSFSAAANRRASTQPAFSRRIRQLEDWLGIPLFDRGARPVRLTAAGTAFLPRAQHIRSEIIDARRASYLERSNFMVATRVFTTGGLSISLAPRVLRQKGIDHASLIVASAFGCIEAVRNGQADHALVPLYLGSDLPPGLGSSRVQQDWLHLAATPAVADQVTLLKKRLTGPLLAYTPGAGPAETIERHLGAAGIAMAQPPLIESASVEALLALAKAGHGAAWLPLLMLDDTVTPLTLPGLPKIRYDILWLNRA